jgi:threonine 3-dehydrogenase
VTVGHPSRPTEIDIAAHINKKGITLAGIFGRRLWETWEQTMLLLDSGRLDLEWLITHRMPLGQIDEAVDLLTGEASKVLLVPSLR